MPKGVRLNTTHFLITKVPNKRGLQQIAINHSSDVDLQNFIHLQKIYRKTIFFLVNDKTLLSDNPLRSSKNLFK